MTKPQRHALEMILIAHPYPAYVTWRSTGRRNNRVEIHGPVAAALEHRGLVEIQKCGKAEEVAVLTQRGAAALDDSQRKCENVAFYGQQAEAEQALTTCQERRRAGGGRVHEKSIRWCGQHYGWHLSTRKPKPGGLVSNGPSGVESPSTAPDLVHA